MPGDKTVMLGFSHETHREAGVLEATEKELEKTCPENGVNHWQGLPTNTVSRTQRLICLPCA